MGFIKLTFEEKRNIWLLLLGRTVSKFGVGFYLIVLPLYILEITESLSKTGIFFSISSIPALVVTPIIGVLIEKVNKKNLLIFCDLFTAIIYIILFFIPFNKDFYLYYLLIGSILINIISNTFEIASKLVFSELLTAETIEQYNGIKSIFDSSSTVIAPALGTVAFGIWGFKIILIVTAITYLLSAIQECFIIYNNTVKNILEKETSYFVQLVDIFFYIKNDKTILKMFILVMALNFFVGNAEEIINPGIIIQKYHISEKLFGLISTAIVIGNLIAGFLIYKNNRCNLKENLRVALIINSSIMVVLGIGSIFLINFPIFYFILFLFFQFINGIITSLINVPLISYFQTNVPINYQGRFFSLLTVVAGILVPLGIFCTGFLASITSVDIACIINNILVIIIVFLCKFKL